MFYAVKSYGLYGIEGYPVNIEVDISRGIPMYNTVGLPDLVVKESRERIRSAIKNSGFHYPMERITINLAPADTKKAGSHYDLPIAVGLMARDFLIPQTKINRYVFIGELALDGRVRGVNGVLPMVIDAYSRGENSFIIPKENVKEATCVDGVNIYPVNSLQETIAFLCDKTEIIPAPITEFILEKNSFSTDFSSIRGQYGAKRAAEIAAAGGHNILLIGSPGSGKTMLAKGIQSILPSLTKCEAIEITKIHSVAGEIRLTNGLAYKRPFRCPHHTASAASLVGGSNKALPGEISLAHLGVLFLDEFPEFKRDVLEAMRQPLEDGIITISRSASKVTYPARFMLIAAMNPCPCGYFGSKRRECTCSASEIHKYQQRISGPMLDRIDMVIEMTDVAYADIKSNKQAESSDVIRKRVNAARKIQLERFKDDGITMNAHMTASMVEKYCVLDAECEAVLEKAFETSTLSMRSFQRIKKVARTIADLDNSENIALPHIYEAIQYKNNGNKYLF